MNKLLDILIEDFKDQFKSITANQMYDRIDAKIDEIVEDLQKWIGDELDAKHIRTVVWNMIMSHTGDKMVELTDMYSTYRELEDAEESGRPPDEENM